MGDAATPALIEALKSPEACLRATALLAQLGPKAAVAAPALAAALGDPNPEVRREALFALASMGAEAAPAQAAITQALDDPEMHVRAIAAYALGSIGQGAQGVAPKLRTYRFGPADGSMRFESRYSPSPTPRFTPVPDDEFRRQ